MSNTDSFIEEVSEEVRRDKFYALLKRYGWIAVLVIVVLVGGTAWNEWRKGQERQKAQALGDAVIAALEQEDRAARAQALAAIDAPEGAARGVLGMLAASESGTENPEAAATALMTLADDPAIPQVYRQLAVLKAVALPETGLTAQDRRTRLEGLVSGGGLIRLLAEEQLAYIDVEEAKTDSALDRLRQISESAEATIGLQQRVAQMIVALGGDLTQTQPESESGETNAN